MRHDHVPNHVDPQVNQVQKSRQPHTPPKIKLVDNPVVYICNHSNFPILKNIFYVGIFIPWAPETIKINILPVFHFEMLFDDAFQTTKIRSLSLLINNNIKRKYLKTNITYLSLN